MNESITGRMLKSEAELILFISETSALFFLCPGHPFWDGSNKTGHYVKANFHSWLSSGYFEEIK